MGAENNPGERVRLKTLHGYDIVHTEPERALDTLTRITAILLDVPISLVSLVTADEQWFKARHGLEVESTPRDISFCTHVVAQDDELVVPDATKDARFADNPLVTGEPHIRFYAGVPLRTPTGQVLGTLCAIDRRPRLPDPDSLQLLRELAAQVMDQLEFRRQRLEIERERNFLRALLDAMSEGVVVQHASGEIAQCNPAAERLLGLTEEQMMGRTSIDPRWRSVHPDGTPFPGQDHPSMVTLRTGEPLSEVPMGVHKPNGEQVWIRINSQPLFMGPEASPTAVITTFRDVTSEERARRSNERDRQLLRNVLERLPSMHILLYDDDLGIPRVFGDAPEATLDLRERFGGEHVLAVETAAQEALTGLATTLLLECADRTLEVSFLSVSERGYLGACVVLDVTERLQLQRQVALQQRLVTTGTLAAGVGHELNNPLTFITANLEYAIEELRDIDGGSPSPRLSELADILRESLGGTQRMRRIVHDLRAFARPETELGTLRIEHTIEMSLNMAMHELRQVATVVRDYHSVPPVLGDEARLSQVLVNLLVNAAQAFETRDPALNTVTIATRQGPDGGAAILIRDNGPGIPPEVRERIFDPFFTTKPPGVGTGLGLSISHRLISGMGGRMEVKSTVGLGTTFTVLLPGGEASDETGEVQPVQQLTQGRVLVIDDEVEVAHSFQRLLRRRFEVVTTQDPRYALRLLEGGATFHAILCDIVMPHLDGLQLLAQLERSRPELVERVLFITGGTHDGSLRQLIAGTNVPVLDKPVAAADLREAVQTVVDRHYPAE